ncbi:MAG: hypothetical protein SGI91_10545 [Alphaproteobacteria bacterium]|nr:hypothetical protein [Alphaproteobacteria bacterium]
MKLGSLGRVPHALAIAGMVSSMGAVSAWGAAGDNGQFVTIEGLYLQKDDGDTIAFTTSDGGGPFALVTTDDLDLDATGGARITAQFAAFGSTWQASGFGVVSFDQDFFISDLEPGSNTDTTYAEFVGGSDASSGQPENSDEIHALDLGLEADLWGAEFSWVKNLGGYGWNNVDFLVGVRYLHYGEELTSDAFDSPNDLTGDDDIDSAFIGVDNDLVGLQIGLQGMWQVSSNVSVGGSLKGGLAANFVDRERSFVDQDGAGLAYADNHDDVGFAQFAEFNPRVDIALSETATLTIGGTVLWINETSRAASHYETLADTTDGNLRDDDDELLYGASIGLKLALN